MWLWRKFLNASLFSFWMLASCGHASTDSLPSPEKMAADERIFPARGVVLELKPDEKIAVIRHETISNFMAAMTMPFKVENSNELAGLQAGDEIIFQLHVNGTESWVEKISKTGNTFSTADKKNIAPKISDSHDSVRTKNPLLDYKFTNELGQAVSINDFHGQALAITFIYTRCPLPDYCPRLSKNFQMASQKLLAMPDAPTNWHFISFSFDPAFDSPSMLKAYADSFQYDPQHWSFLTGPPDKLAELARGSGVTYEFSDGTFNHNFRTLIVDARGHLQKIFPTSGDLSDQIVAEILTAASVTNSILQTNSVAH